MYQGDTRGKVWESKGGGQLLTASHTSHYIAREDFNVMVVGGIART